MVCLFFFSVIRKWPAPWPFSGLVFGSGALGWALPLPSVVQQPVSSPAGPGTASIHGVFQPLSHPIAALVPRVSALPQSPLW